MSPRTKFWLLMVAAGALIGLSFPVEGLPGAALGLTGAALSLCALRVVVKSWGQR